MYSSGCCFFEWNGWHWFYWSIKRLINWCCQIPRQSMWTDNDLNKFHWVHRLSWNNIPKRTQYNNCHSKKQASPFVFWILSGAESHSLAPQGMKIPLLLGFPFCVSPHLACANREYPRRDHLLGTSNIKIRHTQDMSPGSELRICFFHPGLWVKTHCNEYSVYIYIYYITYIWKARPLKLETLKHLKL